MDLPVLVLHKHPQYAKECCELINDEWTRNVTARMRNLECSCDTLPTSLILLKHNRVIGHCKLSVIPSIRDGCFVESVVIERTLRGKGYGKYLMIKAEDHCKNALNLATIYLSNKHQEKFYNRLGYDRCQPVFTHTRYSTVNFSSCITKSDHKKGSENKKPSPPTTPKVENNYTQNGKVYMKKNL